MNVNRNSRIVYTIIFSFSIVFILYPIHDSLFDDAFFDELDTAAFCNLIEPDWHIPHHISKLDAIVILDTIGFIDLLKLDFFLKTYPLQNRNIVDLPLWHTHRIYEKERLFNISLIYNHTGKMNFEKEHSNIAHYLAIQCNDWLEKAKHIANELIQIAGLEDFDFNFSQLIEMISGFHIQERRAGLMFYGFKSHNRWRFQYHVPWYYQERNFFVLEPVQKDLEDIIESNFGISTEQEQERFQEAHLISDKLGLGDTRFMLDYCIYQGDITDFYVGGFITLPTAGTFEAGLKGTHFKPIVFRPKLDFQIVLDPNLDNFDISEKVAEHFGLQILDGLSSLLLESRLGSGHISLGAVGEIQSRLSWLIKRPWADQIQTFNRLSVEYSIPKTHKRWFIACNNTEEFNSHNFKEDENMAIIKNNYQFITDMLTDRFFPFVIPARVHPGIILRWTSQYTHERPHIGFTLGSDSWIRTREKLSAIRTPAHIPTLNKRIAQAPLAYQGKLFATIFMKWARNENHCFFGITIDKTYTSSGIGQDFSITVKFEIHY